MDACHLARMAISNELPEISTPDALPALKEAIDGITGLEKVEALLAAFTGGNTLPALKAIHSPIMSIGARLAPNMSPAQASAWRDAVTLSLSRYTARAARIAAQAAATEPFRYGLGSVDARLHELAKEAMDRDAAALARLRLLVRQIERAMTQKELPPPDDAPMTVEEIAATPDAYVDLGRKLGYISDEEYEAAMALRLREV